MAIKSQNDLTGQIRQATQTGEYNALAFIITQAINKVNTLTLVQVVKCTNSGGVSEAGSVDVVPLVNQIDGQGRPTPHTTIYNVPYLRVQGGTNAVILDPQPGDLGLCGFCSRDISKVKATKKQGNPGSARKYSYSDGVYLGGCLNGVPTQYVQFSSSGITVHSSSEIILEAPTITLSGDVNQAGGSVTLGGDTEFSGAATQGGINLAKITHTHAVSGASTGPGVP